MESSACRVRSAFARSAAAWLCTTLASIAAFAAPPNDRRTVALPAIEPAPLPVAAVAASLDDHPAARELWLDAREALEDGRFRAALSDALVAERKLAPAEAYEIEQVKAEAYWKLDRYEDARASARRAVELRPGTVDGHFLLGELARRSGDHDEAIAEYRRATMLAEEEPNNPAGTAAWFRLGQVLADAGYETAAVTALDRFDRRVWHTYSEHRLDPVVRGLLRDYPETYVDALAKADRLESWLSRLEASLEDPERIQLAGEVADLLAGRDMFERAIALRRELIKRTPRNLHLRWPLAETLRDAGRTSEALGVLADAARDHGLRAVMVRPALETFLDCFTDERGLLDAVTAAERNDEKVEAERRAVFALAAQVLGRDRLAASLVDAMRQSGAAPLNARLLEARLALIRHDWKSALRQAEAAAQLTPGLPETFWMQGQAFAGLDQHADAERALRRAYEVSERDPAYAYALGAHFQTRRDYQAAQRYLSEAFAADPRFGQALEALVDAFMNDGKPELARRQLRSARLQPVPAAALRRASTSLLAEEAGFDVYVAALQKQVARYPKDVVTAVRYAAALFYSGRLGDAADVLSRVRRYAAHNPSVLFWSARLAAARLQYESAIADLERLADWYPNRSENLEVLADVYLSDFRVEAARRVLGRLVDLADDDDEIQARRARLLESYIKFKDLEPALALVREWRKADPEDRAWLRSEVALLVDLDREDEALQEAREYLDQQPRNGRAMFVDLVSTVIGRPELLVDELKAWHAEQEDDRALGELLLLVLVRAERFDEARELVESLPRNTWREMIESRIWSGRVAAAAGDTQSAIREFEALLLEPMVREDAQRGPEVRLRLTAALREAGRHDEALERLGEWLREINPNEIGGEELQPVDRLRAEQLRTDIVRTYLDADRLAAAADRLRTWRAKLEPDQTELRVEVLQYLRQVQQWRGDDWKYAEVLQALRKVSPNDAGLNNDLGYTWLELGVRTHDALQSVQRAVAQSPLQPAYLDSLGWAYYKLGDFERAREHLRRAVRLRDGEDPIIYDHLADAAYRLDDEAAARDFWRKAATRVRELLQQEERVPTWLRGDHQRLLESVESKLAALESEASHPTPAPTAAEQEGKPSPAASTHKSPATQESSP